MTERTSERAEAALTFIDSSHRIEECRCSGVVPESPVDDRDLTGEAMLFKALADPARVAILATLARADHDVCVCDFTAGLRLNQSTVSHHLKLLKDAGLVTSVRRGTWGYYSLAPDASARLSAALSSVLPAKVLA